MTEIAIKVENISKKFQIGENKNFPTFRDHLIEMVAGMFKGPKISKDFLALRNVSFEVQQGEVLGIVGRNGAGKSTLLKILARITEPTTGKIIMRGRVASMLEVGTGFNQELTGRENIYLNGAIIGMTRNEIKQKFTEIVEFSGVGQFLDTQVKHYSSGMYVRLAFAVAVSLDADILLVDEVLAVGDSEFQKKCFKKISDITLSGKTVIFVSHNITAIKKICTKILLLKDGKVIKTKDMTDALSQYEDFSLEGNERAKTITSSDGNIALSAPIWLDALGHKVHKYTQGENPTLQFSLDFHKKYQNLVFKMSLDDMEGNRIFTSHHIDDQNAHFPSLYFDNIIISTSFDILDLAVGKYRVSFSISDKNKNELLNSHYNTILVIEPSEVIKDGSVGFLWHTTSWKYSSS